MLQPVARTAPAESAFDELGTLARAAPEPSVVDSRRLVPSTRSGKNSDAAALAPSSEAPGSDDRADEDEAREADPEEDDAKEEDPEEGDTTEADPEEGDAKEEDPEEGDAREADPEEGDAGEEDPEEGDVGEDAEDGSGESVGADTAETWAVALTEPLLEPGCLAPHKAPGAGGGGGA